MRDIELEYLQVMRRMMQTPPGLEIVTGSEFVICKSLTPELVETIQREREIYEQQEPEEENRSRATGLRSPEEMAGQGEQQSNDRIPKEPLRFPRRDYSKTI